MAIEHQRTTIDPERDPHLANLLRQEFGTSAVEVGDRARAVMTAVAQRPHGAHAWWSVIAIWSRAVVPVSAALAAAALLVVLRGPSELMTRIPTSYPDAESGRGVAVVDILTTRTTSGDVVAALLPPTADELLEAAVRR
jgi:hypothetical protein